MEQLNEIIAKTAAALEVAVAEHGQDSVELGLMIYRVEGISIIVVGLSCLALLVGLLTAYVKIARKIDDEHGEGDGFAYILGGMIVFIPAMVLAAGAHGRLLDVYAWAAAFGYPEVLIGARALQAAGLL